ncbi:MAG: RIP metalloprotease RseP [Paracoccaceae bacterium]|nr:RIP metalloprotease RseP [Paracoccaceae bacterium]
MELATLIPTFGGLAWTIAAFVIALSIIVAVHEYGHYIVGRWSGIKAEVFSVGFGPVLYSRIDRFGTRWQIAALPFGGYVKFLGDANAASGKDEAAMAALDAEENRASMHGAPLWARTATVAAGPIFNFVLSLAVFMALIMYRGVASDPLTVDTISPTPGGPGDLRQGDVVLAIDGAALPSSDLFAEFGEELEANPRPVYTVNRDGATLDVEGPWLYPPLAAGVTPGSAADEAGLIAEDVITTVNGAPIFDFGQLRDLVRASDGQPVTLGIWRDGAALELTMTPRRQDLPLQDGGFETHFIIGMTGGLVFSPATETPGFGEALSASAEQIRFIVTSSISGLYHMIAGKISTCNISGPVGIAETSGQAASQGWLSFFWFIAVLSTAVGLLNLFPIPILDGGHLVFYAWEAVTGHPPSDAALRYLMAGGLTVMLALMAFAITNDLFCP